MEGAILTETGAEERELTVRWWDGTVLHLERGNDGEPVYFSKRN